MVKQTGQQCVFQLIRRNAEQVYLVGDFNGWSTQAMPMTRRSDVLWELTLTIQPGVYRFRYLADGQWQTDYAAFGVERNAAGDYDSVLMVTQADEPQPQAEASNEQPNQPSERRGMRGRRGARRPMRRWRMRPGLRRVRCVPAAASHSYVALAAARQRRMASYLSKDLERLLRGDMVMTAADPQGAEDETADRLAAENATPFGLA